MLGVALYHWPFVGRDRRALEISPSGFAIDRLGRLPWNAIASVAVVDRYVRAIRQRRFADRVAATARNGRRGYDAGSSVAARDVLAAGASPARSRSPSSSAHSTRSPRQSARQLHNMPAALPDPGGQSFRKTPTSSMWGDQEKLVHRRQARQPVAAIDQCAGVARKCRRIAGNADDNRHRGFRQFGALRRRARARRIEDHRPKRLQLGGEQRPAHQIADFRRQRLEAQRGPLLARRPGERRQRRSFAFDRVNGGARRQRRGKGAAA